MKEYRHITMYMTIMSANRRHAACTGRYVTLKWKSRIPRNGMMQGIRIFFLIISLLSGGLIYHEKTTVGFSVLTIYIGVPCFIISSLIAVLITTNSKIKFVHKRLGGFIIWLISITLLICILFVINKPKI